VNQGIRAGSRAHSPAQPVRPSRVRLPTEPDFPVRHGCGYVVLWNAFTLTAADVSAAEKAALFHDTARRIYRMMLPT
jgi:hypothetical protein